MNKPDRFKEIFQEIGLVNKKLFKKGNLSKEEYQKELKPIFDKLKQAIAEWKRSQTNQ